MIFPALDWCTAWPWIVKGHFNKESIMKWEWIHHPFTACLHFVLFVISLWGKKGIVEPAVCFLVWFDSLPYIFILPVHFKAGWSNVFSVLNENANGFNAGFVWAWLSLKMVIIFMCFIYNNVNNNWKHTWERARFRVVLQRATSNLITF